WLSSHGGAASSTANEFDVALGVERVARQLDLLAEFGAIEDVSYTPDPMVTQAVPHLLLGARWRPLRGNKDFRAPGLGAYLQGSAGYAELAHDMGDNRTVAARGLGLGASIGLLSKSNEFAWQLELGDHLAVLGSGEGIRHDLAVSFGVQLYTRTPWF